MILTNGTLVVTRVPVAGTRHAHPAGTVAVIVETPADASHSYRVRFADGFEASLGRTGFVLLNAMQREGLDAAGLALADHDLTDRVIYRCVVGSRAYGLETGDSDVDVRGIYLPPAERHWSLFGVPEQLENAATDEVYWELQKFLVLALKANPNVLEVLHSPHVLHATPLADELLAMRRSFVSKLVFQTYNGYVMSQFRKMTQRRRAGKPPQWKHAMHLIRLLHAGIAALRTGVVPVRVDDRHRERLLAIRRGEVALDEVDAWRLDLHREFDAAYATSPLSDRPDYHAANAFLIRARRAALEESP